MSFGRVRLPFVAAGLLLAIALPVTVRADPTMPAPPAVELLSHGTWSESVNGVKAGHVYGRFRNTTGTQTATDVHLNYDLQGSGTPIHSTITSMAEILGPGEVAPFDDVTYLPPGFTFSGTSLVDGNPANWSLTISQPYHNDGNAPLSVALDPCPNPDPCPPPART